MQKRAATFLILLLMCTAFVALGFTRSTFQAFAQEQTKEELEAQIADRNEKIKKLEEEIAKVERDLANTAKEKQTLQSTIKTIDLSRKKVATDISLTENIISKKDTEIKKLSGDISVTATKIGTQKEAIVESLQELARSDTDRMLAVTMLSGENLGTFFATADSLIVLRTAIQGHVLELSGLKQNLETTKSSTEQKRQELAALKRELKRKKKILDENKKEKDSLLTTTKNKETAYQALLREKQALKIQFETDLRDIEGKLNLVIDPNSIPGQGSGVLSWPLANVRITQNFGNTSFSTANPQIYSGKGHNGIDLAASVGSKILAARGGVVRGTGDTDKTCPNASYGKWILVEHNNGLSTLYAHLSVINVNQGDEVNLGQTIGFSGNTGYSTGPHLHFTVYATQGVKITQFASTGCKGKVYTMPIADPKGYLNPLSYL